MEFPPRSSGGPSSLLADLTEPQLEAVTTTNGPVLVLAGAGSGKTRVITRRAAHLAATVTQPWHVLAITFTNKAAEEMAQRINGLGVGEGMTVCTYHSLCVRILRRHHAAAGLDARFTIMDQSDRRKLVKEAMDRCELSTANFSPASIDGAISLAKNMMQDPEAFAGQAERFDTKAAARVYAAYEQLLAEQNALDFDDLLMRTALLLDGNAEVCGQLADRYRYVLIDEYQDTNVAQYRIARLLTESHRNLFVTGDPDQSIYGWRGADIGNILSFEEDYPDAKVVRLEQNYRSTKRILSAADALVSANVRRKEKSLWTENDDGDPVRVVVCDDNRDEAETVAREIAERIAAGRSASDFAVFYRINALSRSFEEALLNAGVPYRIARGLAFYDRKEIKDVLAYLRVMVNPRDMVSLERIINTPARGIGDTTIEKLRAHAVETGRTLFDVVRDRSGVRLPKRSGEAVDAFAELMGVLSGHVESRPRTALETTLSLSGLNASLAQQADGTNEPLENVNELLSAAAEYQRDHPEATLLDWLSYTSLLGDADVVDGPSGAVMLMTLHAAKGLEFPSVYIVGVEKGLLPFERMGEHAVDEEEERRLFFVGITRTMRELTLTLTRRRMRQGASLPAMRSPFLDELPVDELEWTDRGSGGARRPGPPVGETPEDFESWGVGSLVRHPDFGVGQIVGVYRGARQNRVEVEFPDRGIRNYVVEFSDLERVDFDEVD